MKSLHHLFFIVIVALASHNARAASSNPPETLKEAVDAAVAAKNKKRVGHRKRFRFWGNLLRGNKKVETESPQVVIEVNVASNYYCSSRTPVIPSTDLTAGVFVAETKDIKMGSDSGQLIFSPHKATICSGDTVRWTNNHGLNDNIRFDEDAIPWGVPQEAISMDGVLNERGDTFSVKLTTPGTYEYYSEPFRGAGMAGVIVVL